MYAANRRPFAPTLILFFLVILFLTGCGATLNNSNWPGLTVADDIVYVASGPGVVAVDVQEQQQLWSFPAEPGAVQFYAAPSVSEERVIVGDYGRQGGFLSPGVTVSLYALENLKNATGGVPPLLWEDSEVAIDKIVAPPLQVGNLLFVGTADNYILALDATSGNLLWEFQAEHSIWAQPTYHDGRLYVASMDKNIYAFEAESGELLWQKALVGAIPSKPIVENGTLFIGSFDMKLHALDAVNGEEIWAAQAEDWVWGAAAVADGVVYFADIDGNVFAVNAEDGTPVWSAEAAGPVQADLLVRDGVVYVASAGEEESGQGQLLALDAETGDLQWQAIAVAPIYASPVIVGDLIVIAVQQEEPSLLVYDRQSGTQRWQFTPTVSQS